jgi:hypothetical protein
MAFRFRSASMGCKKEDMLYPSRAVNPGPDVPERSCVEARRLKPFISTHLLSLLPTSLPHHV